MMKRPYESAGALVFDPVASNRNATRASLYSLGFRKVELAPTIDMLTRLVRDTNPDLLFLEVTGAETEVCQFAQRIRQGELGSNPFLVIIVTTWRRDGTVVGKVINSGADDLIARPVSTQTLGERIRLQVERRKGFVVTCDYIGPDRRRDPARQNGECFEVPNTLRLRTIPGLPDDAVERQIFQDIAQGKQVLSAQKVRRDAAQLCASWRALEQKPQGTRDFFDGIVRLGSMAAGIKKRLPSDSEASAKLCTVIVDSAEAIVLMRDDSGTAGLDLGPDWRPRLQQLGYAAVSLGQMFAPGDLVNLPEEARILAA